MSKSSRPLARSIGYIKCVNKIKLSQFVRFRPLARYIGLYRCTPTKVTLLMTCFRPLSR